MSGSTLSEPVVKAHGYDGSTPDNSKLAERRGPERCNKHQRVANVGEQYPSEIPLYVVDLLGTDAASDGFVLRRAIGIAQDLSDQSPL